MKTLKTKGRNRNMTSKVFVNLLKKLYPSCKHDKSLNSLYENHKITYGEMEYNGIEQLYKTIKNINPKVDCFIDIGSGRGKLCMYMASQPKIKNVLGIEIVKERYEDAEELKSKLKSEFSNKVTLLNKNVLEISFKDYLPTEGLVFVWFSNLCFDQEITDSIFSKMREELPKGSIICCSQCPNTKDLDNIPSIKIPMTWSVSTVSIYRL
jgi:hypothetical protein